MHVWDPKTDKVTLAGELTGFGATSGGGDELIKVEEGLLGIELDPDFAANGWVYLHYTPHSEINRETHMAERRVSASRSTRRPTS
ncbi:PQQ-dependent sugar dehydrogenase [Streptomyces thinghirensis]|nr:PQQ-dependent sugar dehydrogenase [Streptomyces thinghirensis]